MKLLPIASLALVITLSGCSNSPSIEEQEKIIEKQVKLIEYENCLATQRAYWQSRTNDVQKIEDYSLGNCADERP